MKKIALLLAVVVMLGASINANAAATTITFQETPTSLSSNSFSIGDAVFTNWEINNDLGTPGNLVLQATSYAAPAVATIDFSGPVNLDDLYLTAVNAKISTDTGASYTIPYVDGLLSSLGLFTTGELLGVSQLTLSLLKGFSTVVIDNMTYTSTPIPGAIWLLGSGLIGMVGLRRRLKK